jgi:hypothetical protein
MWTDGRTKVVGVTRNNANTPNRWSHVRLLNVCYCSAVICQVANNVEKYAWRSTAITFWLVSGQGHSFSKAPVAALVLLCIKWICVYVSVTSSFRREEASFNDQQYVPVNKYIRMTIVHCWIYKFKLSVKSWSRHMVYREYRNLRRLIVTICICAFGIMSKHGDLCAV